MPLNLSKAQLASLRLVNQVGLMRLSTSVVIMFLNTSPFSLITLYTKINI